MEDPVVDAQEVAAARELLRAREVGRQLAGGLRFGLVAVVVLEGSDRLVHRHMEVVVEARAVRRVPRERPTAPRLVALDLRERGARDHRERRVARGQVPQETLGDLVGAGGAARAAVVPARVEHEVDEDQLAPALEHVEQVRLPLRALEDVLLVDLDHREPPPFGAQGIALPGKGLFLHEQRLAGGFPFVSGHDRRKAHASSCVTGAACAVGWRILRGIPDTARR